MRNNKPILLVEDDEIDAQTVSRALQQIKVTNRLYIAGDGEKALEFLKNEKETKPCIILLDLSMPRMNGFELLKIVKQDPELKSIPVVVLTTSRQERDKIEAFQLGASGYMIKPVDYIQSVEAVKIIDLYWTLSELPE